MVSAFTMEYDEKKRFSPSFLAANFRYRSNPKALFASTATLMEALSLPAASLNARVQRNSADSKIILFIFSPLLSG
jgi:hypothetical protein